MPSRQAQLHRQRPPVTRSKMRSETARKTAPVTEDTTAVVEHAVPTQKTLGEPPENASQVDARTLSIIRTEIPVAVSPSVTQVESLEITKTVLHTSVRDCNQFIPVHQLTRFGSR
jgi:hypothetical protein